MALRCLSKKAFALPYRQFSSSVVPAATAVSSSSASSLTTTSVTEERLYLPLSSLLPRNSDQSKASSQVVSLDPSVFSHPIRRDILHLCVVHHRDGLRQGSANTKTRSEIKCSGRKLRPQKGTGRARLGDASSPMLRGGAVAFGPKPRDFSTKLPRKVREMGMRVALSAKLDERKLGVVESLAWEGFKTKEFAERLAGLAWKPVLFVAGKSVPEGLQRVGNNVPDVEYTPVDQLTVYDVVRAKRVVMDVEALEWIEAKFKRSAGRMEDDVSIEEVEAAMETLSVGA